MLPVGKSRIGIEIRTWSENLAAVSSSFSLLAANLGSLMCTEARMVVPKFVGQKVRNPKRSLLLNAEVFSIEFTPLLVSNRIQPLVSYLIRHYIRIIYLLT